MCLSTRKHCFQSSCLLISPVRRKTFIQTESKQNFLPYPILKYWKYPFKPCCTQSTDCAVMHLMLKKRVTNRFIVQKNTEMSQLLKNWSDPLKHFIKQPWPGLSDPRLQTQSLPVDHQYLGLCSHDNRLFQKIRRGQQRADTACKLRLCSPLQEHLEHDSLQINWLVLLGSGLRRITVQVIFLILTHWWWPSLMILYPSVSL